ncbi:MAG TPA: matrixin family metalloprotease [Thermoanaerobaculia bacterium]|nr:matrixin family metalloprotease [Thermoanaerobaculia bacterium]
MSDETLADQTPVIAVVRVAAADAAPSGAPVTEYLMEAERVLKGYLPGSTFVVRVPGGEMPGGAFLKVWGAPRLAPGGRALLFLTPGDDGGYEVVHLMLGAFHLVGEGEEALAVRDLSEATPVRTSKAQEVDRPRRLAGFAGWLADRAAGLERPRDYMAPLDGKAAVSLPFTLNNMADGVPLRWFRFDEGSTVAWRVHSAGQPGMGFDASAARLRDALDVWNGDAGSNIRFGYLGSTTSNRGLTGTDGVHAVLFEDPGDRVPGRYSCPGGGVVALGAAYAQSAVRSFRGQRFHDIIEADVVTNDGSECFFRDNPAGAAEVFAHELGHTLGLGHSAESDALMWPKAHNDGRGARLGHDDRAAVSSLYGDGSYTPPPPPPPPPANEPPAAPARLTARGVSASAIELAWEDKAGGAAEFSIERRFGKTFREVQVAAAGATRALIEGLKPGSYVFRVRARSAAGASPYSNTVTVKLKAGRARR